MPLLQLFDLTERTTLNKFRSIILFMLFTCFYVRVSARQLTQFGILLSLPSSQICNHCTCFANVVILFLQISHKLVIFYIFNLALHLFDFFRGINIFKNVKKCFLFSQQLWHDIFTSADNIFIYLSNLCDLSHFSHAMVTKCFDKK